MQEQREIWCSLQASGAWSPDDPRENVELLRKKLDAVTQRKKRKREKPEERDARLLGEWSDRNSEQPGEASSGQATWL